LQERIKKHGIDAKNGLSARLDILSAILYRMSHFERVQWIRGRDARMEVSEAERAGGAFLQASLAKLPFLSRWAINRGWHYVLAWLHRITGIWLALALAAHIYNLSAPGAPGMKAPTLSGFGFLAWATAAAAGLHAFNGGRLILYELFGCRNDGTLIRWTFGLSAAYAALAGFLMIAKNQSASPLFFWLVASFAGLAAAYAVALRIWKSRHSVLWMLQRIGAAFLLSAVPAYLLFLRLAPGAGAPFRAAVARMQESAFTVLVLLALAVVSLYHAGYGLFSIAADYAASRTARAGLAVLSAAAAAGLAFLALRLLFI